MPGRFYNKDAPFVNSQTIYPPPSGYNPTSSPNKNLYPYSPTQNPAFKNLTGGGDFSPTESPQTDVYLKRNNYRVGESKKLVDIEHQFNNEADGAVHKGKTMNTKGGRGGGLTYWQTDNFDQTASLGAPSSPRWCTGETPYPGGMPESMCKGKGGSKGGGKKYS